MQRQRNLNISFREKDLHILNELKRRSAFDYTTTSGITIHLLKQGLLYEEQKRNSRMQTPVSLSET